jgi:hypothetical protein
VSAQIYTRYRRAEVAGTLPPETPLTSELVRSGQAAEQGTSQPELVEVRPVLEELGGQGGADLFSSVWSFSSLHMGKLTYPGERVFMRS